RGSYAALDSRVDYGQPVPGSCRRKPVLYDGLISVEQLAGVIALPGCVVIDCRFDLADPESGRRAYLESHLPGARYAHLDEHLSGPTTEQSGRHPLPDPGEFCRRLGEWGVTRNAQVVAYDDSGGPFAARLWWLLRWLGHPASAVLNGGFSAWVSSGLEVTSAASEFKPTKYQASPDNGLWIAADRLLQDLRDQQVLLVDARAPDRFRGDVEPIDPVAGHVPDAINLPWQGNLGEHALFLPADQLAARFKDAMPDSTRKVVHMCGSGVTACHNLLALHTAGLPCGTLYAGSWSEWIRDPSRPVCRGSL
ncbi:MAG: sulfurtransferase, partial [Planctomycetales bacterium]|nr:sulfurtransferase [Planctomycetales bacterium]